MVELGAACVRHIVEVSHEDEVPRALRLAGACALCVEGLVPATGRVVLEVRPGDEPELAVRSGHRVLLHVRRHHTAQRPEIGLPLWPRVVRRERHLDGVLHALVDDG
eukprot:CAMPEP_0195571170 /NCGR_PEP_ID=MMETSP0814-20130614/3930_1 /TAXON_ID=97485 /ORGANISM="Prymnesium parvum, Strain Texoma1" /LENGTH=106 /DNA_ID=CAMNT_0040706769 /DNA_START=240 /DNA_END=556 /DNA_ORIENTATION=-